LCVLLFRAQGFNSGDEMSAGRVTAAAASLSKGTPLPSAPAWAGYWTWTTAVVLIMFVLFVARKGTLQNWIAFFTWSTPPPLGSGTGGSGSSGGAGTVTPSGIPGVPGVNWSNPFAGTPVLGGAWETL